MGNVTAGIMDGRRKAIGTGEIEILIAMGIAGIAVQGIEVVDKIKIGGRIKNMSMIVEIEKGIGIEKGTEIEIAAGKLRGASGIILQQAQEDIHRLHRNCDKIMGLLLHPNVLSILKPRHLPVTFMTDEGIHPIHTVTRTTAMGRGKGVVLCRIENTHLVQILSRTPTRIPL